MATFAAVSASIVRKLLVITIVLCALVPSACAEAPPDTVSQGQRGSPTPIAESLPADARPEDAVAHYFGSDAELVDTGLNGREGKSPFIHWLVAVDATPTAEAMLGALAAMVERDEARGRHVVLRIDLFSSQTPTVAARTTSLVWNPTLESGESDMAPRRVLASDDLMVFPWSRRDHGVQSTETVIPNVSRESLLAASIHDKLLEQLRAAGDFE